MRRTRGPGFTQQFALFNPCRRGAEQRLAQFGFARPGQSGNAEDFPLIQPQADVAQLVTIAQTLHLQQRAGTVRWARRREDIIQLMTEHFLDYLLTAQALHGVFADVATIAQHRQAVADLTQFMNAV
ncbi:hypothetical protein D3C73_1077970 [compost metagenome]